jgi:hypothetical protein
MQSILSHNLFLTNSASLVLLVDAISLVILVALGSLSVYMVILFLYNTHLEI